MNCPSCNSDSLLELPRKCASDLPIYRCYSCERIIRKEHFPHPCSLCHEKIVTKSRACEECQQKAYYEVRQKHERAQWILSEANKITVPDHELLALFERLGKKYDEENKLQD